MIKSIARTLFVLSFAVCFTLVSAQVPSAASLYNQGLEKAKAKEYVEALELMEQAIEVADPDDEKGAKVISLASKNAARAAYAIGFQHRKNKEYDQALEMFEKGEAHNPGYYSNIRGKAQIYEAKGMKPEAVSTYITAGEIAIKNGSEDKAQPLFDKAENIVVRTAADKNWDLTIECATAYTEAGKESAGVHFAIAKAYSGQRNTAAAVESVDKAIALAGESDASKYYMLKGECHAKLGQKSTAAKAYGKVTDSKYVERAKYEIKQLNGGK